MITVIYFDVDACEEKQKTFDTVAQATMWGNIR